MKLCGKREKIHTTHTYVRVCVLTSFCTIVFACLGYYLHLSSLCACVRDSLYARVCYICMCVCGRNCKQSEYKNWPLGWGNYFHFLCTLELSLSLPYSVLTFDPCSSNSTRSTSFISHYMVLYMYIYFMLFFCFVLILSYAMPRLLPAAIVESKAPAHLAQNAVQTSATP